MEGIGSQGQRRGTAQEAVATTMAVLALKANEVVTYLQLATLLSCNTVAPDGHVPVDLAKRISRARNVYGARVTSVRNQGYKLEIEASQVDALALLSASQLVRHGRADVGQVEAALALWKQGPPSFLLAPRLVGLFGPLEAAYATLLRQRRKRVLIVDDQVGERIAQLLPDCSCDVAHSLDEFSAWEPQLPEFDLVLVDVHLTTSYTDHDGLSVMHRVVSSRSDVPVLGMTSNPGGSREISANDWTVKHDLVDFVIKRGDDVTADLSPVAEKVRLALKEGSDVLISRLLGKLPLLVRRAEVRARLDKRESQINKLRKQAGEIAEMGWSETTRLGDIRAAINRFRREWRVEFDPALEHL